MDAPQIQHLIEAGLPGARALVHGEAFRGKLPLARHRMVYATLGALMGREIHALALRTLTPDEART